MNLSNNNSIPVVEIFASIQGEGFYSGSPATFIRLAGCDVGCSWCDSINTWNANDHKKMTQHEITSIVESLKQNVVVITGGEPLIYNLDSLTYLLHDKGYRLHLETSGVYPLSGRWDWICLSPKKHILPYSEIYYKKTNELKIIITGKEDYEWAETIRKKVKKECKLYLQPEWSSFEDRIPGLYKYVLQNPYWNISLQLHKFMKIP